MIEALETQPQKCVLKMLVVNFLSPHPSMIDKYYISIFYHVLISVYV